MIILKTPTQIAQIEENGLILRETINEVVGLVKPGITTKKIDQFIERRLHERGALPTFKGYRGFPGSACISVNNTYVHGIPSKKIRIKEGDVVSIDIGVTKNNCIADSCYTFAVGAISKEHKELIKVAHEATMTGIAMLKPGVRIHEIAKTVFEQVEATRKFTVVRGLYGHGTGTELHEAPTVTFTYPCTNIPNVRLTENMVITIEPVIGYKSSAGQFRESRDGWTLDSLDGTYGAQFEHTVAITSDGYKILTGQFLEQDFWEEWK